MVHLPPSIKTFGFDAIIFGIKSSPIGPLQGRMEDNAFRLHISNVNARINLPASRVDHEK